jgi:mRNA-degrading endonuclease YafQ of YafQ-DinJ toxin-antitoxin module
MVVGIANVVFLVLYIDDVLIFSKDVKDIVKKKFFKEFDMKDLGEVLYCLGMQIKWNREEKTIKLGKKRYIEYILIRFGM